MDAIRASVVDKLIDDVIKYNLSWYKLFQHPLITLDIIMNHPKIYNGLSYGAYFYNPNFTLNDLLITPTHFWDWDGICEQINNMVFIKQHINLPWNWRLLAQNNNITVDFLVQNVPSSPWGCWMYISQRASIDVILNNPDKPWNYSVMGHLPIKCMLAHRDKPWNWTQASYNKTLTFKDVVDNLDIPWNIHIIRQRFLLQQTELQLARKTNWLHLIAIHKYFNQEHVMKMDTMFKPIELVLMDAYLVKEILAW